jgi:RimJ/RimL family protein N-acetyltransferase
MASFLDKPTLIGSRITLRPIVASDTDDFWADLDDDEARRLTGTHAEFTREQIDQWVSSRLEQPDRLDLAVVDAHSGEWLGELAILDWDADNRSCGFRIALNSRGRGRGLGPEAMNLLFDYVFEQLPINRVALEVFSFNTRAIAAYERVGFVREGILRQALMWDGEFHDAVAMSILSEDWRRRH